MKKTILLVTVFVVCFWVINGLSSCTSTTTEKVYAYNQVDVEPTFPAGEKAFSMYLRKHIPSALNADQSGIASFTVTKTGLLTDVKILHSVDDAVDAEAIKAFQNSPKWMPAKKDNQTVNVSCVLPFSYLKKTKERNNF